LQLAAGNRQRKYSVSKYKKYNEENQISECSYRRTSNRQSPEASR
jgi:hypothetical protein